MWVLTRSFLRDNRARLVAPIVAISIGVGFVTATYSLIATMIDGIRTYVAADVADSDVIVRGPGGLHGSGAGMPADVVEAIGTVPGVRSVDARVEVDVEVRSGSEVSFALARSTPRQQRWIVTEGAARPAAGTVLVSDRLAAELDLRPGDRLTLAYGAVRPVSVTVAGTGRQRGDVGAEVYADNAWLHRLAGEERYAAAYVSVDGSAPETASRIAQTVGAKTGFDEVTVMTADDFVNARVSSLGGDAATLGALLGAFVGVALVVTSLVIANTYTILLAQRARHLALLRCVGAGRQQVARSVLAEAAVVGLGASVLGVGLGLGVSGGIVAWSGRFDLGPVSLGTPSVTVAGVLVPLLVGIGMTVLAAAAPIRSAVHLSPMAALRPELVVSARTAAGRVRLVAGTAGFLVGSAALAWAAATALVLPGVAAGAVSFVGAVALTPWYVPAVVRVVGRALAGVAGPTVALGATNATRNPRRAAATTSALLVGVTLVTMMSVGASSARTAAFAAVDRANPVDIIVSAADGVSPDLAESLASLPAVAAAATVEAVVGQAVQPGAGVNEGLSEPVTVVRADPSLAAVLRVPPGAATVAPGEVAISSRLAAKLGLSAGQSVRLDVEGHGLVLRVRVAEISSAVALVPPTDFASTAAAPPAQAWVRLADGADVGTAIGAITRASRDVPEAFVGGSAPLREQLTTILNIMLAVVLALLGVAVMIAVVGIANTLSLSVLERSRESAILRAVGLTRGQLRRSVAVEAILLGLVAALLGIVLGTAYGYAGARAVIGTSGQEVPLSIPWVHLGVLVAGACLAGLLASVLPGRRAARATPVEALAAA